MSTQFKSKKQAGYYGQNQNTEALYYLKDVIQERINENNQNQQQNQSLQAKLNQLNKE